MQLVRRGISELPGPNCRDQQMAAAISQDDVITAACVHGDQEECEEEERRAEPGK